VRVHVDMYGSDVVFDGRVAGFAAGSGNAFALLPPQNATGNWIKIVQRVPVRILLDPRELAQHPLRVGLSTTVRVDLHDTSGPLMTTAVRNTPQPSQASAGDDPAVETRIASIITDNAGGALSEVAKAGMPRKNANSTGGMLVARHTTKP
jgi:membrane fusion protein (multidrug efflux system)